MAALPAIPASAITAFKVISAVATVASTINSANVQAANTQANLAALEASANASEHNARIAEQNAQTAKSQTDAELSKQERERRLRIGASIARTGASGLGRTGSALDILSDNVAQEELDILTIKNQGVLNQNAFTNSANLDRANAVNTRAQIPSVKSAGRSQRAATILSGASRLGATVLG